MNLMCCLLVYVFAFAAFETGDVELRIKPTPTVSAAP